MSEDEFDFDDACTIRDIVECLEFSADEEDDKEEEEEEEVEDETARTLEGWRWVEVIGDDPEAE